MLIQSNTIWMLIQKQYKLKEAATAFFLVEVEEAFFEFSEETASIVIYFVLI